jgi:PAS domain S-box-containing protein
MLKRILEEILDKIRNPLLELPYDDRQIADKQITYSNYGRLRYLLFFMTVFSLILLSLDYILFEQWSKENLILLFIISDISLFSLSIGGVILIQKNKVPSLSFQKRIINSFILIGAVWTGLISGQDYLQNDITLVAGVFILTGGFILRGKHHLIILLSLYSAYVLMHFTHSSFYHDPVTDYAIIPGTMFIAWLYGKVMYKNKIDSVLQSIKLQSYSNELQSMVEKRTTELKSKNSSLVKEINNKEFIQNQLLASEELFKSILFQSPDSVAIFKIGGEILQWNHKAEEYSGLNFENLKGKNIWNLFPKIFADNSNNVSFKTEVKEFVAQITANPTTSNVLKVRHWVTDENNHKRYLESKLFPIHLHDKTLISAVSRDITQQLENEDQLKAAIDQAEKANKAKSDFLANISHDLRSPLNSISGFSQLLKMKPNIPKDKRLKYLDIINDNGQYLLQLINSLIDLSKLQTGNIKIENSEINMEELITEINSIIESEKDLYSPNIKLVRECKIENKFIISDQTKIIQIFTNLLSNALKFTKEGSVKFSCKISEGKLIGTVKDTGIGMDQNEISQIFNRFYSIQSDNNTKRKGKGLGLAIVKGYIELLNGKIDVKSEKGEGTEFTFEVPVKEISKKKTYTSQITPPKNKKILIYDPEPESREFIIELLKTYDLEIDYVQVLKELSDKIDTMKPNLVIVDIEPFYSDYKKHLRIIKSKNSELPIIAYTALPQTELPNDLSLLFDVIIFKPINANVLIHKIANHL